MGGRRGGWMVPAGAFLLSAWALLTALACFGVSPFGERTLLTSDLSAQYVHFHAYLRRVLLGQESLLYTTSAGLGTNMLPLYAYYLASPLALLVALFPAGVMPQAILLITVLKTGLCGAAYALFARRVLGARGSSLLFAPCYALCGFAVCYASNVMWLDTVALLPLLIRATHVLVRRGRWGGLLLCLAAAFYTQFYLAYMAGIFTLLGFVGMLWIYRPERPLRLAARFVGAAACAALLCAPLLVPTAMRLLTNAAQTPASALSWQPSFAFGDIFARALFGATDSIQIGLPPIYCGTVTLLLLPAYFGNRCIPGRERLALGGVMTLLAMSLWLPPLTLFWHAFDSAAWFQFRFSFMLSFLWVWMAHRTLTKPEGVRNLWLLLGGALAFALCFSPALALFPYVPAFARRALPWLIGAWMALLLVWRLVPRGRRLALALCVLLSAAEVAGNAQVALQVIAAENGYEATADYAARFAQREALLAGLPATPGDPYRVESGTGVGGMLGRNDGLALGYNSLQIYSSTADRDTCQTVGRFGVVAGGVAMVYAGSTMAMDSLLGIRYLLETAPPNAYYFPEAQVEGLSAYANAYALPMAFVTQADVLGVRLPPLPAEQAQDGQTRRWENAFVLQNAVYAGIGGPSLFGAVPLVDEGLENAASHTAEHGEEVLTAILSPREGNGTSAALPAWARPIGLPSKHMLARVEGSGPVYAYFALAADTRGGTLYAQGKPLAQLNPQAMPIALYVGDYEPGDEIYLVFELEDEVVALAPQALYQLDVTALEQVGDTAWAAQMYDVTWRGHHIAGIADAAPGRDTLLITVPYDAGWHATVNGRAVTVRRGAGLFVAVPLPQGRCEVRLTYTPPGLLAGLGLCAVGVLGLAAALWVGRRRRCADAAHKKSPST